MKKNLFWIFSLFSVFFMVSCASSNISAVKNEGKRILDYKRIVVFSNTADISFRKNLENEIKEKFLKYGKNAVESIILLPPLKEYSVTEIYKICKQNNYDAILSVSQMNAEKETGYIASYGVLIPATAVLSSFDVQLIDLNDEQIILRATVNSEGDSLTDISNSISKKIVNEIVSKEGEEYIPIIKTLLEPELQLKFFSKNRYFITGTSEVGKLSINNNSVEIILPLSFSSIYDPRGFVKVVESEPRCCKLSTTNVDDLPYMIDLIKDFNNSEK
ncbi:hypothetical protein [Treponema sp. C6A8]|uniref:hypothetical protein n=1 Tax=Treponema sp. C6A8 TaxID=1410609 RepID=UPI00048A3F44|nr:hypothetical protein [Treponema sp. C6A8]